MTIKFGDDNKDAKSHDGGDTFFEFANLWVKELTRALLSTVLPELLPLSPSSPAFIRTPMPVLDTLEGDAAARGYTPRVGISTAQ